jgi:hypothetical protein
MNDVKDWDMSALSKDKTSCSTKHCTDHSVTRGDEVTHTQTHTHTHTQHTHTHTHTAADTVAQH